MRKPLKGFVTAAISESVRGLVYDPIAMRHLTDHKSGSLQAKKKLTNSIL